MDDAFGAPAMVIAAKASARAPCRSTRGAAREMVGSAGAATANKNPTFATAAHRAPLGVAHPRLAAGRRAGRTKVGPPNAMVGLEVRVAPVMRLAVPVGATDARLMGTYMVEKLVAVVAGSDPLPRGSRPTPAVTVAAAKDAVNGTEPNTVVHRRRVAVPRRTKAVLGRRPYLAVEAERRCPYTFTRRPRKG